MYIRLLIYVDASISLFFSRNFIDICHSTFAVFYKSLHVCTHNITECLWKYLHLECVFVCFIRVTGQPWNTWLFYRFISKICDDRNKVGFVASNDFPKLDSNITLVMFILHCIKFKWNKMWACSTSADEGQWIATELSAFVWQRIQWTTNTIASTYKYKREWTCEREWYVFARARHHKFDWQRRHAFKWLFISHMFLPMHSK